MKPQLQSVLITLILSISDFFFFVFAMLFLFSTQFVGSFHCLPVNRIRFATQLTQKRDSARRSSPFFINNDGTA